MKPVQNYYSHAWLKNEHDNTAAKTLRLTALYTNHPYACSGVKDAPVGLAASRSA